MSLFNITKRFLHVSIGKSTSVKRVPPTGFTINPFALFVKENYKQEASSSNSSATENIKKLSQKWNGMTDTEKKVYSEKSHKFRAQKIADYDKLSEEEQKKIMDASLSSKAEREKRRNRKIRREENTGRPAQPASSFALFVKQEFANRKAKGLEVYPPSQHLKSFVQTWKNMSETDKKVFEDQAEQLRITYKSDVAAWKEAQKK